MQSLRQGSGKYTYFWRNPNSLSNAVYEGYAEVSLMPKISLIRSAVLIQYRHVTDRRTDTAPQHIYGASIASSGKKCTTTLLWWWLRRRGGVMYTDRRRSADSRTRGRDCWNEPTDGGSGCAPDTSCDTAVCKRTQSSPLVHWLEFNVPCQHKYGYIRDEPLARGRKACVGLYDCVVNRSPKIWKAKYPNLKLKALRF